MQLRLVQFAAVAVVASIVAALVIVSFGNLGSVEPTPAAVVAPERTPTSPSGTPRATASPRPTATPLPAPARTLDLATAPQLRPADKTATLQVPKSPFPDHDGKTIVLYDTVTGASHDLGPVPPPSFGGLQNPFGKDAFTHVDAAGEAWVISLPSMKRTSLGNARPARFVDPYRVLVGPNATATLYDTRTGTTVPLSSLPQPERNLLTSTIGWNDPPLVLPYTVTTGTKPINVADDPCRNLSGNAQRMCWEARPEDVVLEDASGRIVYSFRALRVGPAAPGELLIATPPVCTDSATGRSLPCLELLSKLGNREPSADNPELATGTTNLYILDVARGDLTFIATARYNLLTLLNTENYPLEADSNYVVWTDSFCNQPRGKTRIYDRSTRTITELDGTHWFTLRAGKLGLGEQGANVLIDPGTQRVLAALPQTQGTRFWSSDYRYAAVAAPQGSGGLCR